MPVLQHTESTNRDGQLCQLLPVSAFGFCGRRVFRNRPIRARQIAVVTRAALISEDRPFAQAASSRGMGAAGLIAFLGIENLRHPFFGAVANLCTPPVQRYSECACDLEHRRETRICFSA